MSGHPEDFGDRYTDAIRGKAKNAATLADLVGRLAPDEPVFVLIGRDRSI